MLIVSKFHDYYDTALAHGVDKTCVYNRTTGYRSGTKDDADGLEWKSWRVKDEKSEWGRENEFLVQCVVGCAGNLYPLIYHAFGSKAVGIPPDLCTEGTPTFLYDAESCKKFLDETFPETREHDNGNKYRLWRQFDMSDEGIEEFYQPERHKKFERIFLEWSRSPIFIVRRRKSGVVIETSPILKNYGFMKVKDPYTAMQEIHMYLSGVIGMADRDTAEVGNDDRIKQRGFDKYSFRKDPTKRKPK